MPASASSYWIKAFGWTAGALILAVALLYPQYRDGVDPDATAYFTLARRWTRGDFQGAINGYWSPFSIWLTALLMKVGVPELAAAFSQNTLGALVFLGASVRLFQRFELSRLFLNSVIPALGFFLLHAVLVQWFSDLWGAAFELLALHLLVSAGFFRTPGRWVLYGVLGALAYLAKSVYLPFFVLQTIGAVLLRRNEPSGFRNLAFVLTALFIPAMVCLPWWWALKHHYGFWTTGVAGSLNISWGLVGHPVYRTTGPLLAPFRSDSISFWEDPWWVNAPGTTFWEAPHAFLRLMSRMYYFLTRLLEKSVLLSLVLPVAVLESIRQLFRRRLQLAGDFKAQVLQWVLILFPMPFLLIHSEVRYLWVLAPLTILWVGHLLVDRFFNRTVAVLLALSLCIDGVLHLPDGWQLGRREKAFATRLQAQGVQGDFMTDASVGTSPALRVAYFAGMRYWAAKQPLLPDTIRNRPHPEWVLQAAADTAGFYQLRKF
jgi:hypothetical protein